MSLKRLAVVTHGYNMTGFTGARVGPSLHGNVNVLLSGAMLSGLILVVFFICYCCHRNMNKGGRGQRYWQEESEVPLEVFTVDGETAPSPPPTYESVVTSVLLNKDKEAAGKSISQKQDDSGLPTYEAALRLEAQGYV